MNTPQEPIVHIAPFGGEGMAAAVEAGGGVVGSPEDADGIVWTDPRDPEGLKALLERSPARWVQLPFAGIESFFAAGAIDPNRTWTCTKGVYGRAVAEHALALILAGARHVHRHARARSWREPGFGSPERMLAGSTVLIFGAGGIGRELIRMLLPLDTTVLAITRSAAPIEGVEQVAGPDRLGDLIGAGDFVVIAAPLTEETRGLFDAALLARMKPDAWLINVARGGLVDTPALVAALEAGALGGAALDVTEPEPLPEDHPLWGLDNALITPHVANTWDMAVPELIAMVERNVRAFAAGRPLEGLVDPGGGY